MNNTSMNHSSAEGYVLPRWLRAWEKFWFTPADPTLLALIRILCGAIVAYTLFAYTFRLQEFMGEYAWLDLQMRMEIVRDRPMIVGSLTGLETAPLPEPKTEFQRAYLMAYRKVWGTKPPPPYPTDFDQVNYLDKFKKDYGTDLRAHGLNPPTTPEQFAYVARYAARWRAPPPAYPKDEAEEQAINKFYKVMGYDPRLLYARGMHVFSLWFHVTDPQVMEIIHWSIVATAILFTLGFCTRLTAALTWFGSLCYIHRNPAILFGADSMTTYLLLYLMISPCGAVLSLDQAIKRWWKNDHSASLRPEPSISANVAIRLLQIHVGIIYMVSGLAKLLGPSWWNGTAIWGTIANYEFAPMQNEYYMDFLNFMGNHVLLINLFMTGGGLFTLAFEISYIFLIWRPNLRWVYLGSAILLHGGIGLFMGLKTFALLMLVMNMIFLRKEEVYWILGRLGMSAGAAPGAPPLPRMPESAREPVDNAAPVAGLKKQV